MKPEILFPKAGTSFTKDKENEILAMIQSLEWKNIEHVAIYLPFHLEQIVRLAIERDPLLKNTSGYCTSAWFYPLDFIGLRSHFQDTAVEFYFVTDRNMLIPVVEVMTVRS
ncbi:MAG: hypothetical protein GF344_04480 [Chitinivibrionales bacterium]|nr:hypothetical protein [Chitinivibrionales bacterium]MBD3356299.1 hypothetical protein [Chitinivibrionales bacterium]